MFKLKTWIYRLNLWSKVLICIEKNAIDLRKMGTARCEHLLCISQREYYIISFVRRKKWKLLRWCSASFLVFQSMNESSDLVNGEERYQHLNIFGDYMVFHNIYISLANNCVISIFKVRIRLHLFNTKFLSIISINTQQANNMISVQR